MGKSVDRKGKERNECGELQLLSWHDNNDERQLFHEATNYGKQLIQSRVDYGRKAENVQAVIHNGSKYIQR